MTMTIIMNVFFFGGGGVYLDGRRALVCLSVLCLYLPACLSACLHVCLSVCMSWFICLSVCLLLLPPPMLTVHLHLSPPRRHYTGLGPQRLLWSTQHRTPCGPRLRPPAGVRRGRARSQGDRNPSKRVKTAGVVVAAASR